MLTHTTALLKSNVLIHLQEFEIVKCDTCQHTQGQTEMKVEIVIQIYMSCFITPAYLITDKLISPFLIGISMMDPEKRKKECMTKFDGVYMNEKSYDCAKLAVGSAIGNFLLQFKAWVSCLWREL